MGASHSVPVDSTGSPSCCTEQRIEDNNNIFVISKQQELLEYNAQQKHKSFPPRAIPDANHSVQRKLGVNLGSSSNKLKGSKTNVDLSPSHKKHPPGDKHDTDSHTHGRLSTGFTRIRQNSIRRVRQASSSMIGKVSHAANAVGHGSKRLFHQHDQNVPQQPSNHRQHHKKNANNIITVTPKVRGGVLLRGCYSDEEHKQKVRDVVECSRSLKGREAMEACGFEYRLVHLDEKGNVVQSPFDVSRESYNEVTDSYTEMPPLDSKLVGDLNENTRETDFWSPKETCSITNDGRKCTRSTEIKGDIGISKASTGSMLRLFDKASNEMITPNNRKEFIADGDMYDAIARITQEFAQEEMIREGDLEWLTICDAGNNTEPIRALVSRRLLEDESRIDREPTLLIATGKGKVRAGVFSRQHLLTSGLECSTALPIVREARKRNMMMIIVDPNVHGDRLGMVTFEKTMGYLFRRWESNDGSKNPPLSERDLFVLSHSQSGAQLARYLLDKSEHYMPHLRAVAFTDSTHNIQWAKSKHLNGLLEFLESDDCVYFRCSKQSNNDPLLNPLSSVGEVVETDEFWKHRFGNIKTLCSGTSEHSLTNWFARCHIWDHFDKRMPKK